MVSAVSAINYYYYINTKALEHYQAHGKCYISY